MINGGQAFAEAVARSSRRFRMKLFDGANEVDGNVRSAKIHIGSTGPDSFRIGAVYSAYAEIVLDGRNTALEGKELEIKAGVLAGGSYVYITLGHFTALAPAATKYRTTFTAVGRITAVLAVAEISITTTVTLQQLAAEIYSLTGVHILFENGIATSGTISHPVTGNCRDALAVIALACGGFATETNTGDVLVSRFKDTSNANYGPDTMAALPEMAEYDFEITGVQAVTSTGVFEEGDPVNVSIESDYITESLFESFADSLVGFGYRPGTVRLALGDPRIEPTDVLSVTTPDNDSYIVPCMAVTHVFDGGFQTEITTPAVQTVGEVTGTIEPAVRDAIARANDARKVAVNYLSRDSTGVMVADMADGNVYTPSTVPSGVRNTRITNNNFEVRNGQKVIASFGETTQIGPSDGTHTQQDANGYAIYDDQGNTVAKFGIVTGDVASSNGKPFYNFGQRSAGYETGARSMIQGEGCVAAHSNTAAFGRYNRAGCSMSGNVSIDDSHATATWDISGMLAEWSAEDITFWAEWPAGYMASISGNTLTVTFSPPDEEEPEDPEGLIAVSEEWIAYPRYTISAGGRYAVQIGNGTDDNDRSDAFAITWDGDAELAIDTVAAAETVDGDLYAALSALGWEDEVIL